MELVKREEFDAVKAMAQKAREENEALATGLRPSRQNWGLESPRICGLEIHPPPP